MNITEYIDSRLVNQFPPVSRKILIAFEEAKWLLLKAKTKKRLTVFKDDLFSKNGIIKGVKFSRMNIEMVQIIVENEDEKHKKLNEECNGLE